MAKKIYKYPLTLTLEQDVSMPKGAWILTAQMQWQAFAEDQICLWALVDPEEKSEPRKICIYGTGHEVDREPTRFIATVQDGPYVWHIFE